jgi:hypothetical protein
VDLGDGFCEGVFLAVGQRSVMGDDVEWHCDYSRWC